MPAEDFGMFLDLPIELWEDESAREFAIESSYRRMAELAANERPGWTVAKGTPRVVTHTFARIGRDVVDGKEELFMIPATPELAEVAVVYLKVRMVGPGAAEKD